MFELKPLSPAAIPAALAKAERYRLLNEPEQAQSICEDVLRADPATTRRWSTLILALTDEFPHHHGDGGTRGASSLARPAAEYERAYYGGLVAERRGRALLDTRARARAPAGDWLREAMQRVRARRSPAPAGQRRCAAALERVRAVFNAQPELLVEDDTSNAPVMLE